MSGLASKQQSQKLFEKLKGKQANKVRPYLDKDMIMNEHAFTTRLNPSSLRCLPFVSASREILTLLRDPDLLRLRRQEPNMDVGALRYLPLP